MEDWEGFVERVIAHLHRLRHQKSDLLFLLGRVSKETGEPLPPRLHITERQGERTISYEGK